MRKCLTCRYLVDGPPPHCRQGPPHATDVFRATFPIVDERTWCFKHRYSLRRMLRKLFRR